MSIDGLTVQSVPQALAGPAIDGRGDVVAIAGYFGIPVVPTGCGDGIDPLGPLCDRSTLLAELQWSLVGSQGFSGIGPHVHARAAIGVRLPQQVQRTTMVASGPPLTAVLIGRFGGFLQPAAPPRASAARSASSSTRWPGPRAARSRSARSSTR